MNDQIVRDNELAAKEQQIKDNLVDAATLKIKEERTELTPEELAMIPEWVDKWVEKMHTLKTDDSKIPRAVNWLYKLMGLPNPEIYIVDSTVDAIEKSYELRKKLDPNASRFDYQFLSNGNVSDYGWIAFYTLFQSIGIKVPERFQEYMDNYVCAGIYDAIAYDTCIIVCRKPLYIHKDDRGNAHCTTGPSTEWPSGYKQYHIHGRDMPEDIFTAPITRERFMNEKNADIRGGIYEILGQQGMLDLLGAEVVDEQTVVHPDGSLEPVQLLKTRERFPEIDNQPFCWVQMVCPTSGTRYLNGVPPEYTNAVEAKKFIDGFDADEVYEYQVRG